MNSKEIRRKENLQIEKTKKKINNECSMYLSVVVAVKGK